MHRDSRVIINIALTQDNLFQFDSFDKGWGGDLVLMHDKTVMMLYLLKRLKMPKMMNKWVTLSYQWVASLLMTSHLVTSRLPLEQVSWPPLSNYLVGSIGKCSGYRWNFSSLLNGKCQLLVDLLLTKVFGPIINRRFLICYLVKLGLVIPNKNH